MGMIETVRPGCNTSLPRFPAGRVETAASLLTQSIRWRKLTLLMIIGYHIHTNCQVRFQHRATCNTGKQKYFEFNYFQRTPRPDFDRSLASLCRTLPGASRTCGTSASPDGLERWRRAFSCSHADSGRPFERIGLGPGMAAPSRYRCPAAWGCWSHDYGAGRADWSRVSE